MADVHRAYHREGDRYLIEVNLTDPRQLFNSLDPAPFVEKDLDDDAEAYIVDSVKEFHLDTPLALVIHLPAAAKSPLTDAIPAAIRNYFSYRAATTQRKMGFVIRKGRLAFLFGFAALFACLTASEMIGTLGDSTFIRIMSEGLLIGGWVAMWRPTEVLFYDWWPMRWERRVFRKIEAMPMEVRYRE